MFILEYKQLYIVKEEMRKNRTCQSYLYLIYNAAIAGCFCLCMVFGTPLMILTVPIPAVFGIPCGY